MKYTLNTIKSVNRRFHPYKHRRVYRFYFSVAQEQKQKQQEIYTLMSLPADVFNHIAHYAGVKASRALFGTCRQMRLQVSTLHIWEPLVDEKLEELVKVINNTTTVTTIIDQKFFDHAGRMVLELRDFNRDLYRLFFSEQSNEEIDAIALDMWRDRNMAMINDICLFIADNNSQEQPMLETAAADEYDATAIQKKLYDRVCTNRITDIFSTMFGNIAEEYPVHVRGAYRCFFVLSFLEKNICPTCHVIGDHHRTCQSCDKHQCSTCTFSHRIYNGTTITRSNERPRHCTDGNFLGDYYASDYDSDSDDDYEDARRCHVCHRTICSACAVFRKFRGKMDPGNVDLRAMARDEIRVQCSQCSDAIDSTLDNCCNRKWPKSQSQQ